MHPSLLILPFCLVVNFLNAQTITCSPKPIASSTPLESILHTWPKRYIEYVGKRPRISTCTGVIWLGNNQLISIGVHNHSVDTYQFDPSIPLLSAYKVDYLDSLQNARVGQLENLAVVKDGTLAAVVNNGASFVHLFKISESQLIHAAEIPKNGWWAHGVGFSRNMEYLAYTLFGQPGKIRLFHLIREEDQIEIKMVQDMDSTLAPLHPKGIDFSLDDRFVVICHSINNSNIPKHLSGALTAHSFDPINGIIDPTPLSTIGTEELLCVPEDVCFTPDGTAVLVTNHGNDTVTIHDFDSQTGKIGESRRLLQNPEANLSFPHGLSISPDGKYLAVTNYGDDTVKIYQFINLAME